MRTDAGSPGRPERPVRTAQLAGPALAIAAFVLLGAGAPPAPATEPGTGFIDGPTPGGVGAGGGGDLLAGLGPVLLLALAIAVVIAVAAALILFRTRGAPVTSSSEGWWTCSSCGAGNMDGAARCHACATWRTTNPRPTPSASP